MKIAVLKIYFCDELPQWILNSSTGAYHPHSKTIYIRRGFPFFDTVKILLHELLHWLIDVLHCPSSWQYWIDKKRIFVKHLSFKSKNIIKKSQETDKTKNYQDKMKG